MLLRFFDYHLEHPDVRPEPETIEQDDEQDKASAEFSLSWAAIPV